jgi:hypothetical protein
VVDFLMICYDALSAAEVIYRRFLSDTLAVNDLGGRGDRRSC